MTIYDENEHPRGQADNAGQFRDKSNSVPETSLHARPPRLSTQQQALLDSARQMLAYDMHDLLVSGNQYRTALSLERMGLGHVRYQGHSLGWFCATDAGTPQNA